MHLIHFYPLCLINQSLKRTALHPLSSPRSLLAARKAALESLRTARMPTTRAEEFRFTDISPILAATLTRPAPADEPAVAARVTALALEDAVTAVLVDGTFRPDLSSLGALPPGAYVGPMEAAPAAVAALFNALVAQRGAAFANMNSAACQDVLVISAPAGCALARPVHVLCIATAPAAAGTALPAAHPRLLVACGAGASMEVIEEFASLDAAGAHLTNPVAEVFLGEGAEMRHRYVQLESGSAFHLKSTLVQQAERSVYAVTEARVGAQISRHDLLIDQLGPETETEMRHFLLAGENQLQDLHSKLVLDHPRGKADQLHKCIVAHTSGRGVFDGNVKVNRPAQQTDAGQLSRNLLLAPRATVNVKPNLQIIADDVKCTHGCAVSDLDDNELFYFASRGIDALTARQALVYSFGLEVVNNISYEKLRGRIAAAIGAKLGAFTEQLKKSGVAMDG